VAEGAFGPDLAGRGLNFAQVKQAVASPGGSCRDSSTNRSAIKKLANLAAYFGSMPKVEHPGHGRRKYPQMLLPAKES